MTPTTPEPEGDPVVRLADTLDEVSHSIDRLNVKFFLRTLSTAVEFVILAIVTILVLQVKDTQDGLTDIARINQRNGAAAAENTRILTSQQADTNRILSAVESVTSADARATSDANLKNLIATLLAEIECGSRRQQSRLPAVAPGTCRANTPPEIYPGILGQPTPG